MQADLAGKAAFVAGSGAGVGKAIAVKFAENGADVVVHGRRTEEPPVVDEIRQLGSRVIYQPCDQTDYRAVQQAVENAVTQLGKIDILVVSGGGFSGGQFGLFHEIDPEVYIDLVKRQWFSRLYFAKAVLDHMRARNGGKIIFISTDAGRHPTPGEFLIGGATAALQLDTKVLARELGRWQIHVNSISIAATVDTPVSDFATKGDLPPSELLGNEKNMELVAKLGKKMLAKQLFPVSARDIAEAALFLASEGGDAITGQILSVNGGLCFPG